eukprot:UN27299
MRINHTLKSILKVKIKDEPTNITVNHINKDKYEVTLPDNSVNKFQDIIYNADTKTFQGKINGSKFSAKI